MYSPSYALSIGLFVAIFSLISIIALVSLDGWYDAQNNTSLNNQSSDSQDNDNIELALPRAGPLSELKITRVSSAIFKRSRASNNWPIRRSA